MVCRFEVSGGHSCPPFPLNPGLVEVLATFKRMLGQPEYLLAFFAASVEPPGPPRYDPEAPLNLNLWKMSVRFAQGSCLAIARQASPTFGMLSLSLRIVRESQARSVKHQRSELVIPKRWLSFDGSLGVESMPSTTSKISLEPECTFADRSFVVCKKSRV